MFLVPFPENNPKNIAKRLAKAGAFEIGSPAGAVKRLKDMTAAEIAKIQAWCGGCKVGT